MSTMSSMRRKLSSYHNHKHSKMVAEKRAIAGVKILRRIKLHLIETELTLDDSKESWIAVDKAITLIKFRIKWFYDDSYFDLEMLDHVFPEKFVLTPESWRQFREGI